MGEEIERRHHFVVGVFIAEGYIVHLLEGVQDEETASVLCGADTVLIVEAGVPKLLEISLLPRFGLSNDRWVVFVEGGVVLVKQDRHPEMVLVSRVGKERAGEFSSFRAGEENQETCMKEDLLYSFGWTTIGVKASMAASNLAAMSDDEVIVTWGY